jgi:hypothetical protein
MCEEGKFETTADKPTTQGWLVYEDPFLRWVELLGERSEECIRIRTAVNLGGTPPIEMLIFGQ